MAMFDNEGDSKHALLDDLKSLRSMLDEDSRATAQPDISGKRDPSHLAPVKIPLLQDVFDPEHPEQEIQIEQLNVDQVEQWVTGNLFDEAGDPVIEPTKDQSEQLGSNPGADDEPYTSMDFGAQDPAAESGAELTELYAEYANQWGEPDIADAIAVSKPFVGLSQAETEEFLELLIEEHADEILGLLKDILKDQLSLLVAQVRDNDSAPNITDEDKLPGGFSTGLVSDDQS